MPSFPPDPMLPSRHTSVVTAQERLMQLFERDSEAAYQVMHDLLGSVDDRVKFMASKYMLDKVTPPVFDDPHGYLSKKTVDELVALILGSGLIDDALLQKLAAAKKPAGALEAEVIDGPSGPTPTT